MVANSLDSWDLILLRLLFTLARQAATSLGWEPNDRRVSNSDGDAVEKDAMEFVKLRGVVVCLIGTGLACYWPLLKLL